MSKDIAIAEKYLNKVKNAKDRNIPFNLSLTSFKNIQRAKKCYFTGIDLVDTPDQPNSRTIDRIDPTKGYEKGNVVACSLAANKFKAIIETTQNGLNKSQTEKVIKKCYNLKVVGVKKKKSTSIKEIVVKVHPTLMGNNQTDTNLLVPFSGRKEDDLTGKKVGNFTIIGFLGNKRWYLKCACGNELKLTRGQIKQSPPSSYCPRCG